MKKQLIAACCLALSALCFQAKAAGPTTRGTSFWVGFMENIMLSANGPPQFSFYISSDVNTSGAITLPATGYTQPFTAAAGQVTEVFLPAGVFYLTGSESIANCGFLVTSLDSIELRVQHHRLYFSDASIVLPASELSDEYMVTTHADDAPSGGLPEFVVVATEDNTIIDITTTSMTVGFRPAGIPFSVTLNKGQLYQVQSSSELTGTTIAAHDGKAIAVFSGATSATIQCTANNHIYDQAQPLSHWGNEYMVVPFIAGHADQFRITASENGTRVFINCDQPVVLNKGEYYDVTSSVPLRISSLLPISVTQFKFGQECSSQGDPTMLQHMPLAYISHKAVFSSMLSAISGNQFTTHYVSVITRSANTALVTLDNNPISFTPVPLNVAYSYARVSISPGMHTLLSDSGFYATAYGVGSYDSYSFLAGYDQVKRYNDGVADIVYSDTLCSGGPTAFAGIYDPGATGWFWSFGDGQIDSIQNPAHTYGQPGVYTVTLIALDGGCPFFAQEEVSIIRCFYGEDCELFVPEAFSPNGDNTNDGACVYGACIAEMEFVIYDRWGEVVFKTTDQAECWDGTYKGTQLDNAVFAWVLNATLISGTEITKTGKINLIR